MCELATQSLCRDINVLSGFAFPSSGFSQLSGIPLIRIRDLDRGETEVRFNGPYDPAFLVKRDDILIGMDGDFEVFRWKGELALLNQRVCKVEAATQLLDQSFLYWYLQPQISAIHRRTPQTTVRHLSTKDLYAIAGPCVGVSEQRFIGHILDTLDSAIHETEAIIEKLKAVKQGLLHDLLTRGIDANGELRPPQSEAPHLYKNSPLGWIPKEWVLSRLDDVAVRGSGHTPSKSIPSYWNGGIRWVSLADSDKLDRIYISETDKEISEAGLANSSAVLHPGGSVILSRDAGVGKSAILASEMAVSQHFMAWRCSEALNNLYLYFYLQREKPKFEAIALGSTIKTIGLPFFRSYEVALPPRSEQNQAVAALLASEDEITKAVQEAAKLKTLKSGLMDDLLTGRVRVTSLLK